MEVYAEENWLDVNNTYTYPPNITGTGRAQYHVYAASRLDYQRQPVKPFYLIESTYENEHGSTPQWIRRQAYWSILCGSAGQAIGNRPIYFFDPGWQAALDQSASREMAHLQRLFNALPWHTLVPDEKHEWLTAGNGTYEPKAGADLKFQSGFDYATAALTSDHTCAVAYLPSPRPVTIDLTRMAKDNGAGCWFDPRTGVASRIADFPSGGKPTLSPPGEGDWLLVVASETTIGGLLTTMVSIPKTGH